MAAGDIYCRKCRISCRRPLFGKDIVPEVKVIRRPIIEPYSLYKRFLGFKKDEKIKAGFIEEGEKKKDGNRILAYG